MAKIVVVGSEDTIKKIAKLIKGFPVDITEGTTGNPYFPKSVVSTKSEPVEEAVEEHKDAEVEETSEDSGDKPEKKRKGFGKLFGKK